MYWIEGKPPEIEFTQGIFFVRIEEPIIGGIEIRFDTHVWYGDKWQPFKGCATGTKITHYAYIEDPKPPRNKFEVYADTLGRLECVVQGEIFPDLSTPPIEKV